MGKDRPDEDQDRWRSVISTVLLNDGIGEPGVLVWTFSGGERIGVPRGVSLSRQNPPFKPGLTLIPSRRSLRVGSPPSGPSLEEF